MSFATALAAALRGVAKGLVDYRANKARPASPAMTGAQISAKLKQLQTSLPPLIAWLDAHPGAITAAEDILEALRAGGLSYAANLEDVTSGFPSALHKAEDWLPELIGLLSAFDPVPTWRPGPTPWMPR